MGVSSLVSNLSYFLQLHNCIEDCKQWKDTLISSVAAGQINHGKTKELETFHGIWLFITRSFVSAFCYLLFIFLSSLGAHSAAEGAIFIPEPPESYEWGQAGPLRAKKQASSAMARVGYFEKRSSQEPEDPSRMKQTRDPYLRVMSTST